MIERQFKEKISSSDLQDFKSFSAKNLSGDRIDFKDFQDFVLKYELFLYKTPLNTIEPDFFRNLSKKYNFLKRLLDIFFTILFSPLILILLLLVSFVVWVDVGKPIFFLQDRIGLGGRVFRVLKFRTMRLDSEKEGAKFASVGDARVSRIGKVLRKFRLDEIPQFWNVLKGDMSIIGPRPEQVAFVERFEQSIPFYKYRHAVRPGITGWAQVMQGYAATEDETVEKLKYDIYYIRHRSLVLDIKIVFKTLYTILTGFGAR